MKNIKISKKTVIMLLWLLLAMNILFNDILSMIFIVLLIINENITNLKK